MNREDVSKKVKKKLTLKFEAIRTLTPTELKGVNGGTDPGVEDDSSVVSWKPGAEQAK